MLNLKCTVYNGPETTAPKHRCFHQLLHLHILSVISAQSFAKHLFKEIHD